MPRLNCFVILLALAACLLAPFAAAQAPAPFTIRADLPQGSANVADGGTLTMPAEAIGRALDGTLTITYRGTSAATLTTLDLTGSADFSIGGLANLPLTLRPGDSATLAVRYLPTSSNRVQGRILIGYTEGRTVATLSVNLLGIAPEFVYGYVPQGGNATLVTPGGAIVTAATALDATSNTTVVITNRGTGTGVVKAVSLTGPATLQLVGAPLPNTTIEPGKDLRFTLAYSPKQLETARGTLRIDLVDRSITFAVEAPASGPAWVYEAIQDQTISAVLAGQTIAVPDAVVGDKSTLIVRVRNGGNDDGTISAISVLGQGYQLGELPFLPLTLKPGTSTSFTITFTPAQPGRTAGRLRVGNDTFELAGNGLGPQLAYSYAVGGSTVNVQNNGSVIFTAVAVGKTTSVRFIVANSGTAPATVASISLSGASTVFTLADVPALPVQLASGASLAVTLQFAPNALGITTATLRVDTQSFTLSGSGASPDPLPDFRIEGPSGTVEPLQQPAISLSLARAYPLPLVGTLTLNFNSEGFSNDPSVQFATGGRTANFTIPANDTRAIFANNATQVRLQTGTVAGTISITPSFATEGGVNLTPTTPPVHTMVVAQSAPRLLNVLVSAKTSNGFTLLVTGYATGRAITQMEFQFTPVSGENVGTTRLSVNVEPTFNAWYQSAQSQSFGSQFTATVPFTMQGDVKSVSNLVDTIQSVSVTLSNRTGASAARSVDLK